MLALATAHVGIEASAVGTKVFSLVFTHPPTPGTPRIDMSPLRHWYR